MLLYVFGAGHQNYARCISWQRQAIEIIPVASKKDLFVMHIYFSTYMVVLQCQN